ncbi:MAG: hypothetical protein ACR2KE_04600 [Candidatus Nanopelagicales bacterium]
MKIGAAVLALAVSVSAVLALPAAQAAPARPDKPRPVTTTTQSGTTVLTLDDSTAAEWARVGVRLAPRAPATMKGDAVSLPVRDAFADRVTHAGGFVLVGPRGGKVAVQDLVLRAGPGEQSATLTFTLLGQRTELLRSGPVTTSTAPPRVSTRGRTTTTVRTTTVNGTVRLVDDPALILMLNGAIGAYALQPGQSIGTFTTTIIDTTTVVKPKPR